MLPVVLGGQMKQLLLLPLWRDAHTFFCTRPALWTSVHQQHHCLNSVKATAVH